MNRRPDVPQIFVISSDHFMINTKLSGDDIELIANEPFDVIPIITFENLLFLSFGQLLML